MPQITRIEIYKGLTKSTEYCALFFVDGDYSARIDAGPSMLKIDHKSTLQGRLAGLDRLLNGVTLDRLMAHPAAVINPER